MIYIFFQGTSDDVSRLELISLTLKLAVKMGELIRRLDYQRRTKKNLMVDTGSGQRINKEYSPQVRAANEMEDRKKALFIDGMEKHKKLFLDRYNYDRNVMLRFKADLDAKSVDFNELKFQQLRAQSARGRIHGNQQTNIGPVTEIIPRHYYRAESKSAVKFDLDSSNGSDNDSFDEESENEQIMDDVFTSETRKHGRASSNCFVKTLNSWANITKKPPSGLLRRRRMTLTNIETPKFVPARDVRRQSAPPKVMSALQPRDVKSASLMSRRSSRCSITSAGSIENLTVENEKEAASRSFRLIREAFKMKKIETTDPKQDKLNTIKADHQNQTSNLYERTMEEFEKLFSDQVFAVY